LTTVLLTLPPELVRLLNSLSQFNDADGGIDGGDITCAGIRPDGCLKLVQPLEVQGQHFLGGLFRDFRHRVLHVHICLSDADSEAIGDLPEIGSGCSEVQRIPAPLCCPFSARGQRADVLLTHANSVPVHPLGVQVHGAGAAALTGMIKEMRPGTMRGRWRPRLRTGATNTGGEAGCPCKL
jgi:hypothetical protein